MSLIYKLIDFEIFGLIKEDSEKNRFFTRNFMNYLKKIFNDPITIEELRFENPVLKPNKKYFKDNKYKFNKTYLKNITDETDKYQQSIKSQSIKSQSVKSKSIKVSNTKTKKKINMESIKFSNEANKEISLNYLVRDYYDIIEQYYESNKSN